MTLATGKNNFRRAFTLIELIFVLALLVIVTSLAMPPMSKFVRGRALDTEARRLLSVTKYARERAISEGMPMMLWINADNGAYGVEAETSGQDGDAKAETLTVDSTLRISLLNSAIGAQTAFKNMPAIKFLPDGTVDETSPQTLQLADVDGFSRILMLTKTRTGYEITDAAK